MFASRVAKAVIAMAKGLESTAPAGQVTIYRTPVALLGPQIWAVTVANQSASLAIDVQVSVDAVDSEGRSIPGGARRSTQAIADVFARLRTGPWPDEHHPLIEPGGVLPTRQQVFLASRMDLVAAHNAVDFPRWLRPNQHASALYSLGPDASLRVRIQFEDEAGEVWSRTNDADPERVSPPPPSRRERHRSASASDEQR
ncbi:hypothetical protein MPRM_52150 [Mycobacterium parmense]|uniref:Uncharacterized protein n=1 Tax=Mycobacterium parmense TaxID=185642 RepID=A0A7I7Z3Y1_9MYCO|nr:hypothetical protein MPRM_52150 [Mycobacterium parmense]